MISVLCHQIQDAEEFFKSPEGAKFVKKSSIQDEERDIVMEAKEAGEEMGEGGTSDIAEG